MSISKKDISSPTPPSICRVGFDDEDEWGDEGNDTGLDSYGESVASGDLVRLGSLSEDGEPDFDNISSTDEMDVAQTDATDDDCSKADNEIDVTKFNQPKFIVDGKGKKKLNKPKNMYCDNAELIEEIRKYQEDGIATEKLGELIIKIALHMTTMVRFWRYSHSIKEELAQHAILQMMLSVPKFNLKNEKGNAFGYLSMISYRDMLHTLKNHFKPNKVVDALSEVYLRRMSENSSDERIGMLKQTLARSAEYSAFLKNDRYPFQQRKGRKSNKDVDMFALSRDEQKRRYKEAMRREAEASDGRPTAKRRGRPHKGVGRAK